MTSSRADFGVLVRFEIDLWNAVEHALRFTPGAVTLGRHDALLRISTTDAGVRDVADALHITMGAASRLTDRLVDDGLVERGAHPTDRRAVRLTVTRDGATALAVTTPAISAALEKILGTAGAADLHRAVAILGRIAVRNQQTSRELTR
jgi:DNA-binding MarR family transcriptional regulator